ncbi:YceI family protein [Bdellovibrio bacteriovorus]|uniref:Lipid/polyisoprenoid-binding YceI-like domain-containing protein n=1 Tax=Bdellovibrio bacteriovorus TaxID=959 RepID=A0A150WW81_BDEBC|nr:YceI family protein [Bdellovibrio bacteriovorus]KYG70703.1 hypothetical protein AZI85_01870 [Bdellovibrio bacteriovorus]
MKSIIIIIIALFNLPALAAIEMKSVPSQGSVQFEAIGKPSMMKIKGQAQGPSGILTLADSKVQGEMNFALETLDTGIDLRNEHMKEKYLEVKKYPQAKLIIKDLSLPSSWNPQNAKLQDHPFKGLLHLHGVEKEVEGTLSISEKLKTEARFEIKISDFKIDIPSYLGIKVADVVKVQVLINEFITREE